MLNAKAESTTYKLMTDADMSYSTAEHDTGATWIDGKKIYAITKEWSNQALNNTVKLAHGISNVDGIAKKVIFAYINVNGVAKMVMAIYVNVNGTAKILI